MNMKSTHMNGTGKVSRSNVKCSPGTVVLSLLLISASTNSAAVSLAQNLGGTGSSGFGYARSFTMAGMNRH